MTIPAIAPPPSDLVFSLRGALSLGLDIVVVVTILVTVSTVRELPTLEEDAKLRTVDAIDTLDTLDTMPPPST